MVFGRTKQKISEIHALLAEFMFTRMKVVHSCGPAVGQDHPSFVVTGVKVVYFFIGLYRLPLLAGSVRSSL